MKKEQREIYIELTELCGAEPCLVCKYGCYEGGGTLCDGGEGYYECNNPIKNLSFINYHQECAEPGIDCYGFKPKIKLETLSELTSTILQNGIEEWQVELRKNSFKLDTIQYKDTEEQYAHYISYKYNIPTVTK